MPMKRFSKNKNKLRRPLRTKIDSTQIVLEMLRRHLEGARSNLMALAKAEQIIYDAQDTNTV